MRRTTGNPGKCKDRVPTSPQKALLLFTSWQTSVKHPHGSILRFLTTLLTNPFPWPRERTKKKGIADARHEISERGKNQRPAAGVLFQIKDRNGFRLSLSLPLSFPPPVPSSSLLSLFSIFRPPKPLFVWAVRSNEDAALPPLRCCTVHPPIEEAAPEIKAAHSSVPNIIRAFWYVPDGDNSTRWLARERPRFRRRQEQQRFSSVSTKREELSS